MKICDKLLKELAQLSQTERTVLSVYLDLSQGWDRAEHFLKQESARLTPLLNNHEKDYFQTSLSFLHDYIQPLKSKGCAGPGIAFFADLGADFARGFEMDARPEPLVAVDDQAIIYPLALQLDEYEPVGVIMIDASCARILIAAGQVVEPVDSLRKKIHHLSKVGGWSQMRYQRRRAKQIKHFDQEVIEKAKTIFQEAEVRRIILAGRERMISTLEHELPDTLKKQVIATIPWDLDNTDKDFLTKVRPFLEKAERDQEKKLFERFLGELKRGGLAISGFEPVQNALQNGQVDTLILGEDLAQKKKETLTSLAQATNAYVEFIPSKTRSLDQISQVGALLRWAM